MRELNTLEVQFVAGAGFIQTGLANFGATLGSLGYTALSSALNVTIPGVGQIGISTIFPNLGTELTQLGTNVGSKLGGAIESTLSSLPVVGDYFGKLFA